MTAPPPGPYHTTSGPPTGVMPAHGHQHAIAVLDGPDGFPPIGVAYPIGEPAGPGSRRPAVFELVVGGVEIEGRWIVVDRKFTRLGDAAEWG